MGGARDGGLEVVVVGEGAEVDDDEEVHAGVVTGTSHSSHSKPSAKLRQELFLSPQVP
jgi:serine acetyltransferase